MAQLIEELFQAAFANQYLSQGNDGALLPPGRSSFPAKRALSFRPPARFRPV